METGVLKARLPRTTSSEQRFFLTPPHTGAARRLACALAAKASGPRYEGGRLILSSSFAAPCAPQLSRITGSYLADVLWVWEGEDGQWEHKAPLILRFETCDVVVCAQAGKLTLALWTGRIDTSRRIDRQRNDTLAHREENDRSCLQWLSYQPLHTAIGHRAVRAETWRQGARFAVDLDFGWTLVMSAGKEGLAYEFIPSIRLER